MVAVRWYLRYGLSYRDVEELLAERGVEVDHPARYAGRSGVCRTRPSDLIGPPRRRVQPVAKLDNATEPVRAIVALTWGANK
jgi:hypothetical protein